MSASVEAGPGVRVYLLVSLVFRSLFILLCGVGCGPSQEPADTSVEEEDTSVEPGEPCSGIGTPEIIFGTGGRTAFSPYAEDDSLTLMENSSGLRGFYLESMVEGIDMREAVNIVYRVSIDGGGTDDYITRVGLICEDTQGWGRSFLEFESDVDTDNLAGANFDIDMVATDDGGGVAEGSITLLGNPTW